VNNILNTSKEKSKAVKRKVLLRTIIISALVLVLIVSGTVAWYINNMGMWGVEFNTGNIDFITYVFDKEGNLRATASSKDENESQYINAPLITIENGQMGTTGTTYIAIKSTGSIGIQYRLAFDITGITESGTAYIGGYKYNISKVTDKVTLTDANKLIVTDCPEPEKIDSEMATIDRNNVNGTIEALGGYEIYRMDYTLVHNNEEYSGGGINIYYNIFATQLGGSFDSSEEIGNVYYCSSREDIDRARVEAYPGDIIKLSSDVVYYGDLVFNKPINLETNDFTLTVNGNLIYDYVLGNSLKLDAGGLGKIVVQCTKEGIGGNFQIKAPIGDVTLNGSNASNGDIVVEKNVIIDATNAFGSAGVNFNDVKIVDLKNSRKVIQLESNTRATVAFGTTIGTFQSVLRANNIEIVNNGVIGEINLSSMAQLEQTNSPQIYILNNNDIDNPIMLPRWSVKFVVDDAGNCTGNTKIIQSLSGSPMEITGNCDFGNDDIEVEKKDFLVEQIEEGNDSRLRIYYQNYHGEITTIQSILENYLNNEATSGCMLSEVQELEIVSIGNKAVTNDDISFMNSNNMLSLIRLDMQRATVYDKKTGVYNRLPDYAYSGVTKYQNLVLPQNLVEIGARAFLNSDMESIITVPSGVTTFGDYWFTHGNYVHLAASVPSANALAGLSNINAIFVDETYIELYKSVYTGVDTRIYPISFLDETKTHFIRNISDDKWEITYCIKHEDTVIGENITLDGTVLNITSVYDNAYRHNFTGTTVKFADTVENLGAGNFTDNKNITEVYLNNVKYLGDDAFSGDLNLATVDFGNSLETIGKNAFLNCSSLNSDIALPDTMNSIGASAFQKTKITSVNTGGTVFIDGPAFMNCTELIYAELPNVKVVGESGTNQLFEASSALVSVKMPALIKTGGIRMFYNCTSLREVYFAAKDDGLSLSSNAFHECNRDKLKFYVPEEHIEFYRSKQLGGINASMVYPQGEKMGELPVNGFNIGTYIVSDNGDNTYTLITSNIDYSDSVALPETFNEKPITKIYDNAFRNQKFTNVTFKLGDNIKTIGNSAFYQLGELVKVEFGNSLETIGASAFAYCTKLAQDIVLPDSMERISSEAFRNSGILSINTGGTVSVETRAFTECKSLVYVKMPAVITIAESGTNEVFSYCDSLVSVEMPKVTKVYGSGMFRSCTSMVELHLGSDDENVSLGTNQFPGVRASQVKLYVPNELLSFYQGKSILNAKQVYPEGEKIGEKTVNGFFVGDYVVMENDDGYTLITSNLDFSGETVIPNEYNNKPITEIYSNAFRNQTFTDASLIFGDNLKIIGNSAFYGLAGLKSVVANSVTTVDTEAFYKSGIQAFNGPKLTAIGNSAFRNCANLETVNIPKIEVIDGTYVFAECSALKFVYFENLISSTYYTFYADKKLEKITINRLINSSRDNMPSSLTIDASAPCKIYVPYRSLWAYTDTWSGKPVVTFDISATHNGNTYILSDNNGKYALIDFIPGQMNAELIIPNEITSAEYGNVSVYFVENGAFAAVGETLKSITLPSTVAYLEEVALNECSALENIYVDSANAYFVSVNGVLYSKDGKVLVKYPAGRSGSLDMTDTAYASTVMIGANAFANASGLTEIIFPSSLAVIDGTAFTNCNQLCLVEFTGNTAPVLMGAGIFDTTVEDFAMIVPNLDTYVRSHNFAEYEPYMTLN